MAKKSALNKVVAGNGSNKVSQKKTSRQTRGPKGHVKVAILSALATGPKTTAQLLKAGGFSSASLYLNLKLLEDEKTIEIGGRGLPIRLASEAAPIQSAPKPAASLPAPKSKQSAKVAVLAEYVDGQLQDALEAVSARFVAPDRIGEKLHTLEQLSASLPSAVSEVLMAIRADLLRLSPARSG